MTPRRTLALTLLFVFCTAGCDVLGPVQSGDAGSDSGNAGSDGGDIGSDGGDIGSDGGDAESDTGPVPNDTAPPDASPTSSTRATVDEEGGTVALGEDVELVIPPGALPSSTDIRIRRTDREAPSKYREAGPVYRFEPSGLQFERPALLRIRHGADSRQMGVFGSTDDGEVFRQVASSNPTADRVLARVTHFSFYFPALRFDCPCKPELQVCLKQTCRVKLPHCADGQQDGAETDVDCGGPFCEPCKPGEACRSDRDCSTDKCGADGTCRNCTDGEKRPLQMPCGYTGEGTLAEVCRSGTWERECSEDRFKSCKGILNAHPNTSSGIYTIDPDGPSGAHKPFETYCEMELDGGGWTLVGVVSDDGDDHWTMENRDYWTTDDSTFGSVQALDHDYKNPGIQTVPMQDVLFRHTTEGNCGQVPRANATLCTKGSAPNCAQCFNPPTGACASPGPQSKWTNWAAYHGVSTGVPTLGARIASPEWAYPVCPADKSTFQTQRGYPMSAGTISDNGCGATGVDEKVPQLCETDLYFNLNDLEAYKARRDAGKHLCKNKTTTELLETDHNGAVFGPTWNVGRNHETTFDDPALVGLGPQNWRCSGCGKWKDVETCHLGFATPLRLNTGAKGNAENYMQIFVR
jgi:hypothetical protein